jgi:hypothetical protein
MRMHKDMELITHRGFEGGFNFLKKGIIESFLEGRIKHLQIGKEHTFTSKESEYEKA